MDSVTVPVSALDDRPRSSARRQLAAGGIVALLLAFACPGAAVAGAQRHHVFAAPPSDVVVHGGVVYSAVSIGQRGFLAVFNLRQRTACGVLPLRGVPQALVRYRNYLVCANAHELVLIDIAVSLRPMVVSTMQVSDDELYGPVDLAVSGDLLVAACGRGGVQCFTIAEGTLRRVGGVSGKHWANVQGLALAGDRLLVADSVGLACCRLRVGDSGVAIAEQAYVALPFASRCVAVAGTLAAVGGGSDEVQFLNITDLARPRLLSRYRRTISSPGAAIFAIALAGDQAHVAMGAAGYVVLDVSDPTNPRRVLAFKGRRRGVGPTRYAQNRYYQGLAVGASGDQVFLATERNLEVVNISDLAQPKTVLWLTQRQ
jgi:hypothetical protein